MTGNAPLFYIKTMEGFIILTGTVVAVCALISVLYILIQVSIFPLKKDIAKLETELKEIKDNQAHFDNELKEIKSKLDQLLAK